MLNKTALFIFISGIASNVFGMDQGKKPIELKWAYAKMSHVQKTDAQDLSIIGLRKELQTTQNKAALQSTLLGAVNSGDLQTNYWNDSIVAVDLKALMPLVALVNQLQKEEEALRKQEQQKDFEQSFWLAVYGLMEFYGQTEVQEYYTRIKEDKTIQALGLKIPVLHNCK